MTRASSPPAPIPMQQPAVLMPQASGQRKLTLFEAVSAASSSFGDLTKDSKNDYLKSQYLALPGLLRAIKQPLIEQGVTIYTQIVKAHDSSFVVRTTLALTDGTEELASDFPVFDASNMHKIGAAVTYGTRYNLLALLAICPDNDDDGASAVYSASAGSSALPGLPGGVAPVSGAPWAPQAPMAQMPPAIAQPVQPYNVLQ